MITALHMLKLAAERGWTFRVDQGDDETVATPSPVHAWKLVREVDEAHVWVFDGATRLGWVYLMAPGALTCADEETLVDYATGSALETLCDAVIEECGL